MWSRRAATARHALAQDLLTRLPEVFLALRSGRIDEPRARCLSLATTDLDPHLLTRVLHRVLPIAGSLLLGALRERVLAEVLALDPDWARRRRERDLATRRVIASRTDSGTATLAGHDLPLERVVVAAARIERLAATAKAHGVALGIDALRADMFTGLLDGEFEGLDDADIVTLVLAEHGISLITTENDGDGSSDGPEGPDQGPDDGPEDDPDDGPEDGPRQGPEEGPDSGPQGGPDGAPHDGPGTGPDGGAEDGPHKPGNEAAAATGDGSAETPDRRGTSGPHDGPGGCGGGTGGPDSRPGRHEAGGTPTGAGAPSDTTSHQEPEDREPENPQLENPQLDDPEPRGPQPDSPPGPADPTEPPDPPGPPEPAGTPGPSASSGPPRRRRIALHRPSGEVRAALSTLLGLDDRPGELCGWGPVDAHQLRTLVHAHTAGAWRWVLTDPDGHALATGALGRRPTSDPPDPRRRQGWMDLEIAVPATLLDQLDPQSHPDWQRVLADIRRATDTPTRTGPTARARDPHRRFADSATARAVRTRDRTCIAPACRAPAYSAQLDHTHDHHRGGTTDDDNLGALCLYHHTLKTLGRWHLTQPSPGHFHWTSPAGATYRTRPSPVLHPLPDPPSSAGGHPRPLRETTTTLATDPGDPHGLRSSIWDTTTTTRRSRYMRHHDHDDEPRRPVPHPRSPTDPELPPPF